MEGNSMQPENHKAQTERQKFNTEKKLFEHINENEEV
jgi:hypothetical protein